MFDWITEEVECENCHYRNVMSRSVHTVRGPCGFCGHKLEDVEARASVEHGDGITVYDLTSWVHTDEEPVKELPEDKEPSDGE